MDRGAATALLMRGIKTIKRSCPQKIPFTIENLPPPGGLFEDFFGSLKEFARLKKRLTHLNFTLDVGHAFRSGENLEGILGFLKKYKSSILDIHLHDVTFKGKDHLALGRGDLDFPRFLKTLQDINYKNYLTLETLSQKDTKSSWQKLINHL